jgi:hypothetical protein
METIKLFTKSFNNNKKQMNKQKQTRSIKENYRPVNIMNMNVEIFETTSKPKPKTIHHDQVGFTLGMQG